MSEVSRVEVRVEEDKSRVRGVDVPVLMADSNKFRDITGWEPRVPFKITLTTVLEYWKGK